MTWPTGIELPCRLEPVCKDTFIDGSRGRTLGSTLPASARLDRIPGVALSDHRTHINRPIGAHAPSRRARNTPS